MGAGGPGIDGYRLKFGVVAREGRRPEPADVGARTARQRSSNSPEAPVASALCSVRAERLEPPRADAHQDLGGQTCPILDALSGEPQGRLVTYRHTPAEK